MTFKEKLEDFLEDKRQNRTKEKKSIPALLEERP